MVGSDHDFVWPMPALVEVAPGRWRVGRKPAPDKRSVLAFPMVISDQMDPTEQVDGKFYESKRAFRKVGRQLGLTEMGDQPAKKTVRSTDKPEVKRARRETIGRTIAEYRAGRRPKEG